ALAARSARFDEARRLEDTQAASVAGVFIDGCAARCRGRDTRAQRGDRRRAASAALTRKSLRGVEVSKLCVRSFAISIDGYGAGPGQDLKNPLGVRGTELMEWFFNTRVWRQMQAEAGGETGIDNAMAEQGFAGIGAWILGRNMFGPVRGKW